jgi:serine/threonine-protein kinase
MIAGTQEGSDVVGGFDLERMRWKLPMDLGGYVLEELIGSGGMGLVYRARHQRLGKVVAIKALSRAVAATHRVERFEREARLASQLAHPNTCGIFDFGVAPDGTFYYVMEHCDGLDLAQLVAEYGRQPVARVRHVLAQMCASLAEAHALGLVHRDVKPGNVILGKVGGTPDFVKVIDFGLVKDLRASAAPVESDNGLITGTPGYLAPEAITAPESVDTRSDVYAVGAVGYYLLTGGPVFEGGLAELCGSHLHTLPDSPSERRGEPVPAKLERVILACLEKEPGRRPRDARALREALLGCDDVGTWSEERALAWWKRQELEDEDEDSGVYASASSAPPPAMPGSQPPRARRSSKPAMAALEQTTKVHVRRAG